MTILDDKPTPPKLPFARATIREHDPNAHMFEFKEVEVYTKEQLEAYGRQMQIYGLVVAQSICNEYDGGWYAYRKGAAECSRAIGIEILTTITPDGLPLHTTTTKDRT